MLQLPMQLLLLTLGGGRCNLWVKPGKLLGTLGTGYERRAKSICLAVRAGATAAIEYMETTDHLLIDLEASTLLPHVRQV